jgi:hypothetical protein
VPRKATWKTERDALFRGAFASTPGDPVPTAPRSIVRHILYLEGFGRETPYLSASEARDCAERFAQEHDGAVWETTVARAQSHGVNHRSRKELLNLLKGTGKGDASGSDAYEVMRAAAFVERHLEHLLDFRHIPVEQAASVARAVFTRS